MFQRILVILDDTESRHCVYNAALGFAKTNSAQLGWVDRSEHCTATQTLTSWTTPLEVGGPLTIQLPIELMQPTEKCDSFRVAYSTDRDLLNLAQDWNADLIITGRTLNLDPAQPLPCSILVVQQAGNSTISMTMQLKPKPVDWKVRDRLEKLLQLTSDA